MQKDFRNLLLLNVGKINFSRAFGQRDFGNLQSENVLLVPNLLQENLNWSSIMNYIGIDLYSVDLQMVGFQQVIRLTTPKYIGVVNFEKLHGLLL